MQARYKCFQTFFADGIFIDRDVLVKLGKEIGFDAKTVKRVISDEKYLDTVHERAKDWVRVGVKSECRQRTPVQGLGWGGATQP